MMRSAAMRFSSIWSFAKSWFSQTSADGLSQQVQAPILSEQQIHALGDEVSQIVTKPIANPKASEARKQGEQASRYLGSGMEYEESRRYQPGDEVRRINWRLMARTGQAHTKLFQEERQESWTLLLDQRQSMRFGTRQSLKVVQAARAAGFFAWQAQQSGLPVEGIALSEQVRNSATFEGNGTFERFMEFASVPCPPLAVTQEPRLYDELLVCQQRLQSGDRLIILSDFKDLDEATLQLLAALQDKIMIKAVLVYDPVEKQLPPLPGLKLQSLNGEFEVSQLSAQQAKAYQQWSAQYFDHKIQRLNQVGVTVVSLSTVDSLQVLNDQLNVGGVYARA
ncbi:hypothetical protein GHNINEIG_00083 [Hydrogenovibrio crunogenus]|uniref:DUF58 domain-containing protein n=1 Tax=Hydrogenovibrio crunogenus TaxID=39765 RepID=A0A4P7NX42_9GAMM|nr:DUF58 domain-containing protein [Hydrogenovibrio crunogenus]QBZ82059.1 hypothetical protein GHNINEIG_00083 [Hydrogenovibrio crunogenus]